MIEVHKPAPSPPSILSWGVTAYLILLPWQIELGAGTRVAPADLAVMVVCALGLGALRLPTGTWSIWHGLTVAVFPASTLYAMALYGEASSWAVINKVLGIVVLAAAYLLVVSSIVTWRELRQAVKVFVASVAGWNFLAIVLYLGNISLPTINVDQYRLSGGLVDPNAWGSLLGVALIVHIWARRHAPVLFGRVVDVSVTLSLIAGLGLTVSRTALMGVVAAFVVWTATSTRRSAKAYGLAAAFAVAAIVASNLSLIDSLLGVVSRPETIISRLELIENAVRSFFEAPVFGIGLGVYEQRYGIIVHVSALWFAAEMGLIGLTVFTGMVVWTARTAIQAARSAGKWQGMVEGFGYAHVAMIAVSFGIEAFYQRHWWLIIALVGVSRTLAQKEPTDEWAKKATDGWSVRAVEERVPS